MMSAPVTTETKQQPKPKRYKGSWWSFECKAGELKPTKTAQYIKWYQDEKAGRIVGIVNLAFPLTRLHVKKALGFSEGNVTISNENVGVATHEEWKGPFEQGTRSMRGPRPS